MEKKPRKMKIGDKVRCINKFDQYGLFIDIGETTHIDSIGKKGDLGILTHSIFGEDFITTFLFNRRTEETDFPYFNDYFIFVDDNILNVELENNISN